MLVDNALIIKVFLNFSFLTHLNTWTIFAFTFYPFNSWTFQILPQLYESKVIFRW